MQDVTERKKAEKELDQYRQHLEDMVEERTAELSDTNERLEEEIARRSEFTRTLTHELKTPLTSVMASSDLLVATLREEPMLGLAKNVYRSAANLNNRVDELLDMVRSEMGTLELKLETVDMLEQVREVTDAMTPVAAARGQTLVVDLPPSLPSVHADASRIQQILGNILDNAFKFTPQGGKVTLKAKTKGSSLVVEVRDTGRGISKDEQDRLFEPYHRVERDRERFSGLGLGLALCKTLVELHGGQVWVASRPGKGSTFSFSLPLGVSGQTPVLEAESSLWKVLMVEDDPEIVNSVSLAFQLLWPEAQVISTRLGEEGVEMVETETPDVVILDLGLPDISGLETLEQIRSFSTVPVVVLTVKGEEDDIATGLECGADDYLVKPFKQLELVSRLKVQLRKQTPADEETPVVCGLLRFDPSTSQFRYGGREISLTMIEGQIIECLMRSASQVVTYSRLAEAVWGEEHPGALESLRVHIRRLREKLETDPGHPRLILTKAGVGYSLTKSASSS